jgi:2-polyprenyl-3-methyl-5-hydroxy-6-metoxy-1,4-benzoquinol methylase
MKQSKSERRFASHLPDVLAYHARMLSDGPRNLALRKSIESLVTADTCFLDVGAGTGVWAILAAKLGAKRVVAVEIEESLIPLIHKHAQENGVADRIEIIHGNIDDVDLDGKFDLVVAEFFGVDVYGEKTINSFISLRERFLAPGGMLLPQKMDLYAAPLLVGHDSESYPAEVQISTEFLKSLLRNYGVATTSESRKQLEFAAEPQRLIGVDYHTITEPLPLIAYSAEWQLEDVSRINSFMVFSITEFAAGITLDSLESKTWILLKYDFLPFEQKAATIRFALNMDPEHSNWSVSLPSHPEVSPQSFAPMFAYTRARMAHSATPHKKVRAKKRAKAKE